MRILFLTPTLGTGGAERLTVTYALGMLHREGPGHRAAPVMSHQRVEPAAQLVGERGDVGHQVLAAVRRHLGRRG